MEGGQGSGVTQGKAPETQATLEGGTQQSHKTSLEARHLVKTPRRRCLTSSTAGNEDASRFSRQDPTLGSRRASKRLRLSTPHSDRQSHTH